MGLLKQPEYDQLIKLIRRIPDHEEPYGLKLLKQGIPSEIRDQIEYDGAPKTHLENILRTIDVDLEIVPESGKWPVITLVENAIFLAKGSNYIEGGTEVVAQLKALHKNLVEDAVQQIPDIRDNFAEALVNAFPTVRKLELFLLFSFDENLHNVAGGTNLLEKAQELVVWTIDNKRLCDLIDAAVTASPQDPYIRAVAVEAFCAQPSLSYVPGQRLNGIQIRQLSQSLVGAFIYQELRDLSSRLGIKLETVSLREEILDVATDLILYTESRDLTEELIAAAIEARPTNRALLWIVGRKPPSLLAQPTAARTKPPLAGSEVEALMDALVRAFSYRDLRHFVVQTFGREIDVISLGENLDHVAFELVVWAERQDLITDLVDSALRVRPGEPIFQSFPHVPDVAPPKHQSFEIDEEALDLTRRDMASLHTTLLETFSYIELDQVVQTAFHITIENISLANNLSEVAFDLLLWAERQALLRTLFSAALSAKPQNLALRTLATEHGITMTKVN